MEFQDDDEEHKERMVKIDDPDPLKKDKWEVCKISVHELYRIPT